jgi:trigger factor
MAEEQEVTAVKNTVVIEEAGPCKKKVIVEVAPENVKKATDEQYESLRTDAIVPGFRKGRAPRRLLEKRFGKEASEQIKLKLLADASDSALKDNNLDVLREPDIDYEKVEVPESGPLKFEFEVEVRPEFELPSLEGIGVEKKKLEVTEEQLDAEIEQMRKLSGLWTPREEGKVELDDQVIADVLLKAEDMEEAEKLDNIQVYVRPNGFVGAVPVEELDKLLVGAEQGDSRKTTVDVAKTFFREEYRGRKVDVTVTMKEIKYLKPAELGEQFFQRHGVENEAELRDKLRDYLQEGLERRVRAEMTEQIYKYLLDNTSFDLPEEIVGEHSAELLQRQYTNLMMRGLPREQVEQQMEQLRASSEEQAKQQFKTYFIMDKVADELKVEVTEEEVNGHIAQLAIQRGQRPEQMREQMLRDGSLAQFRVQVREDKCVEKLLESASISEVEPKKKTGKTKKKPTSKKVSEAKSKPAAKKQVKKKKDD